MFAFSLNNDKGSGLVEVMIAVVILSIGLIGASKMSYSIVHGNRKSGQVFKALNLAQSQVEIFQNEKEIEDTKGVFTPSQPESIDYLGNKGGIYKRTWLIEAVTAGNIYMKNVIVKVSWPGIGGNTNSIFVNTIVRL